MSRPVVVIGSLNMDLVVRCDRLPKRGQTIMGGDFFTAAGGKGANQAVAAARLGADVTMAGCVGRDAFGDSLVAGLRDAGVGTQHIRVVEQATGTALITVEASGANTIVVVSGANLACDPALAERVLAERVLAEHALAGGGAAGGGPAGCGPAGCGAAGGGVAKAGEPGILLLQHEIPPEANARAIAAARRAGWFVMLNPAPARPIPRELLPLIDLVTPNETEAAILTGRPVDDDDGARAAAQSLLGLGARAVIVTRGGQGVLYCDAAQAWQCPAATVQAVDTTAAGDAYVGALAAALAEGQDLPRGLGFAASAAGLSVTRRGAQPSLPTRAELTAFVAQHGAVVAQPFTG